MKIRILLRENLGKVTQRFRGTTSASGHIRSKHIGDTFSFLCELSLNSKVKTSNHLQTPLQFLFHYFFGGGRQLEELQRAGWRVGNKGGGWGTGRGLAGRRKTGSERGTKCRLGRAGKLGGPLDGLAAFDDFKKVQPSPLSLKRAGKQTLFGPATVLALGRLGDSRIISSPAYLLGRELWKATE